MPVSKRAEKRRELRAGPRSESSGRLIWILGGAAVIAVAIVAWNLVSSLFDNTVRAPVPVTYDSPQELLELAQGVDSGNPDASVTIMEFADYQCPSCQAFAQQVKPIVDLTYVQTGSVRLVFYDFPLSEIHPNAFLAARAARCAGDQGAYWEFHDRLFQTQPQWSNRADPSGEFVGYAAALGLARDEFRSCLRSDRHAEVVSANRILGEQLGVTGTPTILMDSGAGRAIHVSDWGIPGIRQAVDGALQQGTAAPAPDAP
jgi:protein-disulfide isomerase